MVADPDITALCGSVPGRRPDGASALAFALVEAALAGGGKDNEILISGKNMDIFAAFFTAAALSS